MESTVFGLTCNYMDSPVGLDSLPAFSWKYRLTAGSGRQRAYRIAVAAAEHDLSSGAEGGWDSGVVESPRSHAVEYGGPPLAPRTLYHWRVTVFDEDGGERRGQSRFETGRLGERWAGKWISAGFHQRPDGAWKSSRGPIVFNGIRNGEHCDARLARPGWCAAGFDDAGWEPATVTRSPGGRLEAMEMEPIRITGRIAPTAHWETPDRTHVFDIGQNMAGVAEITVDGAPGDEIVIRYSEQLHEDGVRINQGTVSGFVTTGEFQTDRYIKAGDGLETWRPKFVYHGFQYIEVSGCLPAPRVEALVLHTDVADSGSFSCADETLNKIQHAARWSTLSNLQSIPTDDVALSAEQMLYNFHTVPLLRKWLADVRDSQRPDGALPCVVPSTGWGYNWGNGPDWSSALTVIPWQIYLFTGDRRVLRENYEAVTRHFGYMEAMAQDLIVGYGIGDWCPPFEGPAVMANMASFKTPVALTDTACFYNAADTIARMAAALGLPQDERAYRSVAQDIKTAFRDRFYDADTHAVAGDCQTSTACMIYQGLFEDGELEPVLQVLAGQIAATGQHQDTGILGSKYLYHALGESGRMDLGLQMVLNETYPSYRHWIDRGATTLWECWNGQGSRNHHMFSDISAVLYKYVAGIRPDEHDPGFRHILMKPAVDCGLPSVCGRHESPFGAIVSQWEIGDGQVAFAVEIPGGCRATFGLPAPYDGREYPRQLGPGRHRFTVPEVPRLAERAGLRRDRALRDHGAPRIPHAP